MRNDLSFLAWVLLIGGAGGVIVFAPWHVSTLRGNGEASQAVDTGVRLAICAIWVPIVVVVHKLTRAHPTEYTLPLVLRRAPSGARLFTYCLAVYAAGLLAASIPALALVSSSVVVTAWGLAFYWAAAVLGFSAMRDADTPEGAVQQQDAADKRRA